MELNAEQIKKALECCASEGCEFCPNSRMPTLANCVLFTMGNALALITSQEQRIKELTEENEAISERYAIQVVTAIELDKQVQKLAEEKERLREDNEIKSQKRANIFEIANAYERGKADTVRNMQERLIAEFRKDDRMNYYIRMTLDQIAKEMLEDKPCT